MLFTSASLLLFICILFRVNYIKALIKYQVCLLIAGSLAFYFVNSQAFGLLVMAFVGINACLSWLMSDQHAGRKKCVTMKPCYE